MDVGELRRRQLRRETAAYLSVPAFYLAFMLAGVFLFVPEYLVLNFFLVLFVLLQLRSGRMAATLADKTSRPRKERSSQLPPAIAEADQCFLVQVNYQSASDVAAFLVFLAAIDFSLRTGAVGGPALVGGAVVALAVYVAGRRGARAVAWRAFAGRHPDLWNDPAAFEAGKAVGSTGHYYDWRLSVERGT